uniref:Uncharacterized protein n=1 Tax=Anguilla anguilla TaxID=7936 RepID=A0A0E9V9W8_ANGAN
MILCSAVSKQKQNPEPQGEVCDRVGPARHKMARGSKFMSQLHLIRE